MLKRFALTFTLLFVLGGSVVGSYADSKGKPGDWARYDFLFQRLGQPEKDAKPSVKDITITLGQRERRMRWWEMTVRKPDDSTFTVRILSERPPMTASSSGIGHVERYLFKDGDRPFLEYRNNASGGPLLPEFDFRTQLLPCPTSGSSFEGIFAATGTYLGCAVQLVETGRDKSLGETGELKVLSLDPTLLIGSSRWYRETEEDRITDRDYTYRPLLAEDIDEMVAAGMNLFRAVIEGTYSDPQQEAVLRERPVFYYMSPTFDRFPNMFYRSNYRGLMMFTDEPAILTSFSRCRRVADAPNLLRTLVAASVAGRGYWDYSPRAFAAYLEGIGVYLGTWELIQRDIPSWEAITSAAYDEMQAGVSGIIHEGRYNTAVFNTILADHFGPGFDLTEEEMLRMHYAFLRGAARCFDGNWGTSIYGQADPAVSPSAVSLAYDMGARYIWFWTSDRGHNLLYQEQLDLTRITREREKTHPRRPVKELLGKAEVAIAFPEGYIGWSEFWPTGLWGNERFGFKKLNEQGAAYGSVVAEAMRQGAMLARQGVEFDFVVDGESARKARYKRLIRVHADGSVKNGMP